MKSEGMHRPVHGVDARAIAVAPTTRSSRGLGIQRSGVALCSRARAVAALGVAAVLLGGCTTNPPIPTQPAPTAASLEEWLNRGDAARKEGLHEASRSAYRDGAKAYPTDKQPWLRLADSYFHAGDYGNAVLAAQEAVQRDPKDNTAHSLLAVSGLRITAGSLNSLREQSGYPVGSREEALEVTRRLREALSDPTLPTSATPEAAAASPVRKRPVLRPTVVNAAVTPPTAAATHPAAATSANAAAAAVTRPAAQTPSTPGGTATTATTTVPPKAAGNPLDKLK